MYHFIFFPFFHPLSIPSHLLFLLAFRIPIHCSCAPLSLQNEQCSTDVVPSKIITIRVEAESGKAVAIATANKINAICCKRNFLAIVPKPWQTEFYDATFSSFMSVKILLFYIITYIRYSTKNNIEREKIKLQ